MQILGWHLTEWKMGPWGLFSVQSHYTEQALGWAIDRMICIGPLQTRWFQCR